jgi:putative copper export protein
VELSSFWLRPSFQEDIMNRFSKVCLLIIIVLLALVAVRPFVPQPAIAAAHGQYLVTQGNVNTIEMQKELDSRAADGWELVAPVVSEQTPGVILIFRKER